MTDKERLENIKFLRNSEKTVAPGMQPSELISRKDVDWLIEQAERVQELEKQNKRYRKAIKECVERMNAGGAGTRSFVYEKLIEVLEGEK